MSRNFWEEHNQREARYDGSYGEGMAIGVALLFIVGAALLIRDIFVSILIMLWPFLIGFLLSLVILSIIKTNLIVKYKNHNSLKNLQNKGIIASIKDFFLGLIFD